VARLVDLLHCQAIDDNGPLAKACGQCRHCKLHASGNHPDHYVIKPLEGKVQIAIDQIRQIGLKVTAKGLLSNIRIVQIEQAQQMTVAAANALLKMLEEPPQGVYFILTSDAPHQLPATVLSRCISHVVKTPPAAQVLAWLNRHANIDTPITALELQLAKGSPLRALDIANQGGFASQREVVDGYLALLAFSSRNDFNQAVYEFIELLRPRAEAIDDTIELIQWSNHLLLKHLRLGHGPAQDYFSPVQLTAIDDLSAQSILRCEQGIVELKQQLIANNGLNALLQLQQVIVNLAQPTPIRN